MQKKIIFLTGCASGIGKYLAEQLYQQGHFLVVSDINIEYLQQIAQQNQWGEQQALVIQLDVRDRIQWQEALQQTLDKWQRVDVLMNVAGVIKPGYIHETPFESIDFQIDINLKGTILGTKIFAEQMVKQQHGHIINIASLAGITPALGLNLYCASKFGVRGFSLTVAQELKKHHIRISVVCPDAVATPMLTLQLDYPEAALTFSNAKPLTTEKIGQVILKKAFQQQKLEVVYPLLRGWIAKLVSFRPTIANWLTDVFVKQGQKRQEALKRKIQ